MVRSEFVEGAHHDWSAQADPTYVRTSIRRWRKSWLVGLLDEGEIGLVEVVVFVFKAAESD